VKLLCGQGKGNTEHKREAYGWRDMRRAVSTPWLQHKKTGEIVYVYGKLDDFIDTIIGALTPLWEHWLPQVVSRLCHSALACRPPWQHTASAASAIC